MYMYIINAYINKSMLIWKIIYTIIDCNATFTFSGFITIKRSTQVISQRLAVQKGTTA